jgi:hypothetical protein
MLRTLLAAAGDGTTYDDAVGRMLAELGARGEEEEAAAAAGRVHAALLGLSLVCAASSAPQLGLLVRRAPQILAALVEAACVVAPAMPTAAAADTARALSLQALTVLSTNDQVKLQPSDGAALLLAAGSVCAHLELRTAPPRAALPSAHAFGASYFLLVALLRQRGRLVHSAAPLLLAAVRGLLHAVAHAPPAAPPAEHDGSLPLECVRNLRRLLELLAAHKKALVRHCSYVLADLLSVCRERPLPAAAQRELLPGIHAVLGICTEVEVQAVHAASDAARQRVLKDLLESYERSFKYQGKA